MTWRIPFLAAYPYLVKFPKGVEKHADAIDLFVDSGAFTAWTLKKVIELDEYCQFIDGLPIKPWNYLTLDVIGDPEGTLANYNLMRERGFKPVPIVTRGDDEAAIEGYFDEADFVAFGGMTGTDRASSAWCRAVMEVAGKRRAHLLGMTRFDWIKELRPYSVDSSSWMQAARFGTMAVYMGHGVMTAFKPKTSKTPPPRNVAARIARYGIDPYALNQPDALKGAWGLAQRVSAMSWVEFSRKQQTSVFKRPRDTAGVSRFRRTSISGSADG